MTAPADQSFGFLLSDTARLLRRRFDAKARGLGLTRAQWRVLAYLARQNGRQQCELAEVLEVEPITLSRLIDRMEDGGWVERRPDPGDRRAHLVFMSEKAPPALARMHQLAEVVYAEAFAGLPPKTRQELTALLAALHDNLACRSATPDAASA
ncbi:MAG: MarR family winged helix-turn-helix transcriptional regulator [Kiloniellales bacterium]